MNKDLSLSNSHAMPKLSKARTSAAKKTWPEPPQKKAGKESSSPLLNTSGTAAAQKTKTVPEKKLPAKAASWNAPRKKQARLSSAEKKERRRLLEIRKNLLTYTRINPEILEAYKTMRINLLNLISECGSKVVLVSGTGAYPCKTLVSANLALSLAKSGHSVALVDADTDHPFLNKLLGIKNAGGLSEFLAGKEGERPHIIALAPNIDVMTAGRVKGRYFDLLGSDRMKRFIALLERSYEYVIIDTPPVGVNSDALAISDACAGIILVVKQAHTTYDMLDGAIQKIKKAKGNLLGVVIGDYSPKEMY
ncbi:MAG: CpsD/CapB family tyrosine-protein kinase [Oscillospiraceae bacterium]|jgi:capsular exopolysaccharide synthesis family protein|nr:CpsD/CapB family tyrosine-protein kinase [Oscillospiraceae bacterium]